MTIPIMQIAMAFADLVPSITRWFSDDPKHEYRNKGIADTVIDIAKRVTGSGDAAAALRVLQSNPNILIEFQKSIMKVDRDLESAYLYDRQDARSRDIAMLSSGRYNFRADVMVVSAAFGLLSCLVALAYYHDNLPGEAVGIISTVAGIFGSCLKDAYSFEFGSSRGSKTKDLAALLKH